MPRHPPNALTTLNRSHCQCSSSGHNLPCGRPRQAGLPFTTQPIQQCHRRVRQVCFIGATPSSSLAACLKTSFSRLNPGSRGQATIISKPSEADPRKDQPTTTDQSDKLPTYLPSFPKLRSARPWQGSSGQGSDTGLPRYLEASRSIFSLQCIWNRRRPTGRRKLILSPRISSPLVSTPKSYWWS